MLRVCSPQTCVGASQAMKDLVSDANFECSPQALSLQAMDTSHVALVQMTLRSDGFAHFRCDRNISMGEATSRKKWLQISLVALSTLLGSSCLRAWLQG